MLFCILQPEGRGAAAAGSEGVLANFFNSLLSKGKPQTPGQPMNASTPMPTRPGMYPQLSGPFYQWRSHDHLILWMFSIYFCSSTSDNTFGLKI